jgi:hypothetical protein
MDRLFFVEQGEKAKKAEIAKEQRAAICLMRPTIKPNPRL